MSYSFADTVHDVCAVGSGPAGIIVALEYTRANWKTT
jgi:thioredoxin reductase